MYRVIHIHKWKDQKKYKKIHGHTFASNESYAVYTYRNGLLNMSSMNIEKEI